MPVVADPCGLMLMEVSCLCLSAAASKISRAEDCVELRCRPPPLLLLSGCCCCRGCGGIDWKLTRWFKAIRPAGKAAVGSVCTDTGEETKVSWPIAGDLDCVEGDIGCSRRV